MPNDTRSFVDVIQDTVSNIQDIVGSEIRLARSEMTTEAKKAAKAGQVLAAGPEPAPRSQAQGRPPPAPGSRRAMRRRTPAATNAAGPGARPWPRRAGRPQPGDRSRPDGP